MAASPEFYKPSSTPAFSPLRVPVVADREDDYYYSSCRTPTGSGISYLREPTTCPPAPRKAPPPPCKKRLFHHHQQQQEGKGQVPLITLRLDELHSIFRPHPEPKPEKRRRSARHQHKLQPAAAAPLQA
ncbi:hypothetical protein PR202_gb18301 [Eleusine coracana subsp. coracana]|uniref:Uncharacterized protein n=1 Tax=Eleusine coracana subsp. coracana TaxID=191504 RepID=A0AAV5F5A3_ELECO|nr:hypothetical protein QOZ80_3BG0297400 [Eleusine coracana subsp. coracana]GJN30027.1 hypothetical protein PR202_gb18301 [Eleusine coracana subsp. coracana]